LPVLVPVPLFCVFSVDAQALGQGDLAPLIGSASFSVGVSLLTPATALAALSETLQRPYMTPAW
jgi:ABC-type transport system involved in cytochrome c biogenesis permease component